MGDPFAIVVAHDGDIPTVEIIDKAAKPFDRKSRLLEYFPSHNAAPIVGRDRAKLHPGTCKPLAGMDENGTKRSPPNNKFHPYNGSSD